MTLDDCSRLKLRLPSEDVAPFIALAGQALDIDGHRLQVGVPSVRALTPAANLAARLVTFRHAMTPDAFEADVQRELDWLEIKGIPQLVPSARSAFTGQPIRRVLRIKEKVVVGFALRVGGLTTAESIRLQEEGLGGRGGWDAGFSYPWGERSTCER